MQFQVLIENGNYILTHFINSDIDLLNVYKNSLITDSGYIVWDNGVVNCKRVVGIMKMPE
jgi:hypothetical protein